MTSKVRTARQNIRHSNQTVSKTRQLIKLFSEAQNTAVLAEILSAMSQIDWADINSKLPFSREAEDTERRKEIWADIDVNGNGFVSLSEVTMVCPVQTM